MCSITEKDSENTSVSERNETSYGDVPTGSYENVDVKVFGSLE